MRALAVAEAEMAGGELERRAREDVARPGPAAPRPQYRVDARALVDVRGDAHQARAGRGRRRVVAAADVHFDVAKAVLCEMRFQLPHGAVPRHVRHESKVELRG